MFKYGRMQKGFPSVRLLVCGSCGVCLDCTLPEVRVTAGLGFFLHANHLSDYEHSDSLLLKPLPSLQVPSGIVIRNHTSLTVCIDLL